MSDLGAKRAAAIPTDLLILPACPCRQAVLEAGEPTMDALCENYPNHQSNAEVLDSNWIIGRAYSAAIERCRVRDELDATQIAPMMINSLANLATLVESGDLIERIEALEKAQARMRR